MSSRGQGRGVPEIPDQPIRHPGGRGRNILAHGKGRIKIIGDTQSEYCKQAVFEVDAGEVKSSEVIVSGIEKKNSKKDNPDQGATQAGDEPVVPLLYYLSETPPLKRWNEPLWRFEATDFYLSSKAGTENGEFLPFHLPRGIHTTKNRNISVNANDWMSPFETREWKAFTVQDLPQRMSPIEPGEIGDCHVIRCWGPWDFHLILLDSTFDLCLDNFKWTKGMKKPEAFARTTSTREVEENYGFVSHEDLFWRMSSMMAIYANTTKSEHKMEPEELFPGDLVIALVSRLETFGDNSSRKMRAYRAVVIESVAIFTLNETGGSPAFKIFLLDTGEKRVLTRKYLRFLPEVFTGFRPMAVKCALHGVSPIGPEWSQAARIKTFEFMSHSNVRGKLIAEFYSHTQRSLGKIQADKHSVDGGNVEEILSKLVDPDPLFVELYFHVLGEPSVNINTVLLEEKCALEWSLIPQRCHLRRPTCGEDSDGENIPQRLNKRGIPIGCLNRPDALQFCQPHPPKLVVLPSDQYLAEYRNLLKLPNVKLDTFNLSQDYGGVLALKVFDPDGTKQNPSVPTAFKGFPE